MIYKNGNRLQPLTIRSSSSCVDSRHWTIVPALESRNAEDLVFLSLFLIGVKGTPLQNCFITYFSSIMQAFPAEYSRVFNYIGKLGSVGAFNVQTLLIPFLRFPQMKLL